MPVSFHKNVSSIEAIASSIETDEQVYRWFTFLIVQPALKANLLKEENAGELYAQFKKAALLQRTLYSFLLLCLCIIVFSKKFVYLGAGILFIYPLIKIHLKKKDCVVKISTLLLKHDFDMAELCQKTLYQLGEIYSRKYNIPSLVDTIYALDNVSRKAIIFAFIFTAFIYPLKVWQIFLRFANSI